MNWVNVTASAHKANLDDLETWFWDHGAVSVTVEDGQDNPIFEPPPGETPVWDEVLVTGLFENDVSADEISSGLAEDGFDCRSITDLEDRPWEREWLSRFEPMQFGERLWVCPTGFELDASGKTILHLDPGLAFGTGTHETTRLCLEYMDSLAFAGSEVIDYGCGSGILAIAAALLGADKVQAIDNDVQALHATEENARRNGVEFEVSLPGVALLEADILIANILAQPLVDLSGDLLAATASGGKLILSGIMSSQAEWVAKAYSQHASLIDETELNGWVRLVWMKS